MGMLQQTALRVFLAFKKTNINLPNFIKFPKFSPTLNIHLLQKNHITSPSHTERVLASFGSVGSWENENKNQWTKVPGGDQHADPIPSGKL